MKSHEFLKKQTSFISKKIAASLILMFLFVSVSIGQTKSYEGFKRFYGAGINAITENNEVKGYYMFGVLEKSNKNEKVYRLTLLDNNLTETHSIEMKKPSKFYLLEGSYNGERFCFSFVDLKGKSVEYLLFNKDGKPAGTYKESDLSNTEIQMIAANVESEDYLYSGGLAAVQGKGFVRYGIEKEKGFRISIEMFDNAGKRKWSANSGVPMTSKSFESVIPYYADANYVVSNIMTREKRMSDEIESSIVCLNAESGKEIFKIEGYSNPKYNLLPEGVAYDESTGEFYIYGEFAKPKDIVSLGLYIQIVDKTGKITKESYSTWTGDIFKVTPGTIKAKMEKNMKIAIHKIVRTADGNFFAVGEQFRKAVSGLGVASKILAGASGGQSDVAAFKIEVHNMMMYKFDSELKITSVDLIEKDKTNILLPNGAGINGSTTLGYYVRTTGGFDYAYTALAPDKKTFNAAYVDYDRDKEEGNKMIVGNIVYNGEEKYATDKVEISSKASNFWVKPAKPGYVCIFEYFRKAKRLDVRMEKLNL